MRSEQEAHLGLAEAQLAQEYIRAQAQSGEIEKRLADVALAQSHVQKAAEQLTAIAAPSDADMVALREALEEELDAQRKLDLSRVSTEFTAEKTLQIEVLMGENPGVLECEPNKPVQLAGSPTLAFRIPGIGQFNVAGPATDYASLRLQLERLAADVATFADRFGTKDVIVLEDRRRQAAQQAATIQEENRAISTLLDGNTEDFLREELTATRQRINDIELTHPSWRISSPDAGILTGDANQASTRTRLERDEAVTAVDQARSALASADSGINHLEATRSAHDGHLKTAKDLLTNSLNDGLAEGNHRAQSERKLSIFPERPDHISGV